MSTLPLCLPYLPVEARRSRLLPVLRSLFVQNTPRFAGAGAALPGLYSSLGGTSLGRARASVGAMASPAVAKADGLKLSLAGAVGPLLAVCSLTGDCAEGVGDGVGPASSSVGSSSTSAVSSSCSGGGGGGGGGSGVVQAGAGAGGAGVGGAAWVAEGDGGGGGEDWVGLVPSTMLANLHPNTTAALKFYAVRLLRWLALAVCALRLAAMSRP